jgi:DNA-binding protein HU-beta
MAETISKAHLVDKVSETTGVSKKDAKAVIDQLFEHMSLHLSRGDRINVTGFGTFEVRERAQRQGVRPGTSERITIPASRAPAFKAGKTLKDSVNNR